MTPLRVSLLALSLVAAGCSTPSAATKIPPTLLPAQGKWLVAAYSKNGGTFSSLTGAHVVVKGNMLILPSGVPATAPATMPAGVVRQIALTPGPTPETMDITLSPLPGQSGWTLVGISRLKGDNWYLNLSAPADNLHPDDFLPRDDASDVVILRKE